MRKKLSVKINKKHMLKQLPPLKEILKDFIEAGKHWEEKIVPILMTPAKPKEEAKKPPPAFSVAKTPPGNKN